PTRIHYGTELGPSVAFYLDLALAHYNGTLDSLVGDLRARLEEIDGERPLGPASAALDLTGGLDIGEGDAGVVGHETASSDLEESSFAARRCERRARRWP